MDNKNFFLAIFLSVGFLVFWTYVVAPKFTPQPVANARETTTTPVAAPNAAPAENTGSVVPSGAIGAEQAYQDAHQKIILSGNGGGIKEWTLKLLRREVNLV